MICTACKQPLVRRRSRNRWECRNKTCVAKEMTGTNCVFIMRKSKVSVYYLPFRLSEDAWYIAEGACPTSTKFYMMDSVNHPTFGWVRDKQHLFNIPYVELGPDLRSWKAWNALLETFQKMLLLQ